MNESRNNSGNTEGAICGEMMELAGEYVDNELSEEKKLAFEKHIEECPTCTAFLASYKTVVETAHELGKSNKKPLEVGVQNRLRGALNRRLGLNLPYIA